MSPAKPPPLPPRRKRRRRSQAPGVEMSIRLYQAICFFALSAIFLIELQRGIGLTSILIFLVGILTIISRLRMGPFFVLFVLSAAYFLRAIRRGMIDRAPQLLPDLNVAIFQPVDALLSVMMLIFVVAHYRLQALQLNAVPVDTRRILPKRKQARPERRSARLVTATEIVVLLCSLVIVTMFAQAVWLWTQQRGTWVGFHPRLSRLFWLLWIVGFTAMGLRMLLRLVRRYQMRRDEAQLVLQDALWRQTRREQSRIHGWQAWAELRRGNKH